MTGRLLLLGMIAGMMAGVLAFGAARVWGEPPVAAAIALEEVGAAHEPAHDHAVEPAAALTAGSAPQPASHSHGGDGEGVSRTTQAGVGLFTGIVVFGAALGGILSLIFAFVQGRVSHLSPQATAGLITLAGFVALVLVPQLKYPANPPAVGHGETIGLRTAMFFLMLAISVAGMVLAVILARSPAADRWRAGLTGAAVYGLIVVGAASLLPSFHEVPAGFPADLLWQFRIAALLVLAVLWGATGLIFGWLVQRELRPGLRASAV